MKENSTSLSPDKAIEIMELYQETNCNDAATTLLIHYEPIVRIAASKMSRNRPDLYEDMFQVGQMSLLRLFKQYDSSIGKLFEAYAMKSLIGQLKNYLRDKSWYVQVPRRIKEKSMLVQQAINELTITLERSPKTDEISEYLNLSHEETLEVLAGRESYYHISLNSPLSSDESSGVTIEDLIGDKTDDYHALEKKLVLEEALLQLKKEEKTVLYLAFTKEQSQRRIAEQLGISQMSVSRIQKRAIEKLKDLLPDITPNNL